MSQHPQAGQIKTLSLSLIHTTNNYDLDGTILVVVSHNEGLAKVSYTDHEDNPISFTTHTVEFIGEVGFPFKIDPQGVHYKCSSLKALVLVGEDGKPQSLPGLTFDNRVDNAHVSAIQAPEGIPQETLDRIETKAPREYTPEETKVFIKQAMISTLEKGNRFFAEALSRTLSNWDTATIELFEKDDQDVVLDLKHMDENGVKQILESGNAGIRVTWNLPGSRSNRLQFIFDDIEDTSSPVQDEVNNTQTDLDDEAREGAIGELVGLAADKGLTPFDIREQYELTARPADDLRKVIRRVLDAGNSIDTVRQDIMKVADETPYSEEPPRVAGGVRTEDGIESLVQYALSKGIDHIKLIFTLEVELDVNGGQSPEQVITNAVKAAVADGRTPQQIRDAIDQANWAASVQGTQDPREENPGREDMIDRLKKLAVDNGVLVDDLAEELGMEWDGGAMNDTLRKALTGHSEEKIVGTILKMAGKEEAVDGVPARQVSDETTRDGVNDGLSARDQEADADELAHYAAEKGVDAPHLAREFAQPNSWDRAAVIRQALVEETVEYVRMTIDRIAGSTVHSDAT